jgi:hypothetical protein
VSHFHLPSNFIINFNFNCHYRYPLSIINYNHSYTPHSCRAASPASRVLSPSQSALAISYIAVDNGTDIKRGKSQSDIYGIFEVVLPFTAEERHVKDIIREKINSLKDVFSKELIASYIGGSVCKEAEAKKGKGKKKDKNSIDTTLDPLLHWSDIAFARQFYLYDKRLKACLVDFMGLHSEPGSDGAPKPNVLPLLRLKFNSIDKTQISALKVGDVFMLSRRLTNWTLFPLLCALGEADVREEKYQKNKATGAGVAALAMESKNKSEEVDDNDNDNDSFHLPTQLIETPNLVNLSDPLPLLSADRGVGTGKDDAFTGMTFSQQRAFSSLLSQRLTV